MDAQSAVRVAEGWIASRRDGHPTGIPFGHNPIFGKAILSSPRLISLPFGEVPSCALADHPK